MGLSLDLITLGAADPVAVRRFYTQTFSLPSTGSQPAEPVDLHGTGRLAVAPVDSLATDLGVPASTTGFRGYVLSTIVDQPRDVETLLEVARANEATTVKPAKKQLFGEFTAVYRAPDGALWKIAAAGKKNGSAAASPVRPVESALYLGVASPKASRSFYESLGMLTDRDYGEKFIDFTVGVGASRLGLLPRKALAKDAGVADDGDGFRAIELTHLAASDHDLETTLAAARNSGAQVTQETSADSSGAIVARFADPDGYRWRLVAPPN
ncbi:VOC family protein [Cellulosimicrobium cellulans]|uniref:VOC family protein n=1 Tax=Cellulosimicrobium cellulans TaxID=1710 RepID=UPI0038266EB8